MRRPSRSSRTQSMVEVIMIVGLVALLLITAIQLFQAGLRTSYLNQQQILASPL